MPWFPLPFVPAESYKTGGRKFGADRGAIVPGLKHAGCDLLAPAGTDVLAVDEGVVVFFEPFHLGTWALAIQHPILLVRYCGVEPELPAGVRVGARLRGGQLAARVGDLHDTGALHLEMYSGTASGRLTVPGNMPYARREDLLDPTPFLDQWALVLTAGAATGEPRAGWKCKLFGRRPG